MTQAVNEIFRDVDFTCQSCKTFVVYVYMIYL